jgi:DNA polymerase-3 subunit delta'
VRGDGTTRRAFTAAIDRLEHDVGLLRLNLNENAALEEFLLSSLRLWSKRG